MKKLIFFALCLACISCNTVGPGDHVINKYNGFTGVVYSESWAYQTVWIIEDHSRYKIPIPYGYYMFKEIK